MKKYLIIGFSLLAVFAIVIVSGMNYPTTAPYAVHAQEESSSPPAEEESSSPPVEEESSIPPTEESSSPPPSGPTTLVVKGWAWSSNIGWISFSNLQPNSGGGRYAVIASASTGAMSGYAWSSNVGWLSFNAADVNAAGCGAPATINLDNGNVSGWIVQISDNSCMELSGMNHETTGTVLYEESPFKHNPVEQNGVSYDKTNGRLWGFAFDSVATGWTRFRGTTNLLEEPPPGVTITANACTANSGTNDIILDKTGGSVEFAVTNVQFSDGISRNLIYNWRTGQELVSTNVGNYTKLYTGNTTIDNNYYLPSVVITVDGDPTITSQTIHCPKITIPAGITEQEALKLNIGKPGKELYSTLRINQNSKFSLKWVNNLNTAIEGAAYRCYPMVSTGASSEWKTGWGNILGLNNTIGSLSDDPLNSGTTPGTYKFWLSCTDDSTLSLPDKIGDEVTLIVTSATETEI